MNSSIKNILVAIIAVLAIALIAKSLLGPKAPAADTPTALTTKGALEGTGLRFDGYYVHRVGDLFYLIRFFPEGRVVTVNGTKEVQKDLPAYLVRETRGNPGMVRFIRHSHITGTRQLMEYIFHLDGSPPSEEDSTQGVQPA
mgnify:CR=1 FL=1